MIFSQKITERGKPDPSECMSFLTARNLVSRIHRICFWPSRVFGSSSGHLRIVFGLFEQRYPADQKARRLWVRDWLRSLFWSDHRSDGQGTQALGKRMIQSAVRTRQDPSGRPARVVKRWGGGSPSSVAVTSDGNLFPILRKTIWQKKSTMNHNSRAKESISRGKKRLKAQIPFTTHWHFAMFALINCSS